MTDCFWLSSFFNVAISFSSFCCSRRLSWELSSLVVPSSFNARIFSCKSFSNRSIFTESASIVLLSACISKVRSLIDFFNSLVLACSFSRSNKSPSASWDLSSSWRCIVIKAWECWESFWDNKLSLRDFKDIISCCRSNTASWLSFNWRVNSSRCDSSSSIKPALSEPSRFASDSFWLISLSSSLRLRVVSCSCSNFSETCLTSRVNFFMMSSSPEICISSWFFVSRALDRRSFNWKPSCSFACCNWVLVRRRSAFSDCRRFNLAVSCSNSEIWREMTDLFSPSVCFNAVISLSSFCRWRRLSWELCSSVSVSTLNFSWLSSNLFIKTKESLVRLFSSAEVLWDSTFNRSYWSFKSSLIRTCSASSNLPSCSFSFNSSTSSCVFCCNFLSFSNSSCKLFTSVSDSEDFSSSCCNFSVNSFSVFWKVSSACCLAFKLSWCSVVIDAWDRRNLLISSWISATFCSLWVFAFSAALILRAASCASFTYILLAFFNSSILSSSSLLLSKTERCFPSKSI